MVHAEPEAQIITVHPGKNTLKDALSREDLKDGDILQLEAGSYTSDPAEDPVTITKAITIKGHGSSLSGSLYTTLSIPLVVDLDDASESKKVTLQGFASSNQTVTPGYKFITVNSPVDLTINDVRDWGIHHGDFIDHDAMSLYVKSEANGAKIQLNNVQFFNGTLYGIRVEASDTEINIKGGNISGRTAISLANGSNNKVAAVGTAMYGRYINYTSEEVIDINQQTGSALTFENCNITSSASKSTAPSIISLVKGNNTGTTINLNGATSITDGSSSKNADSKVIFRFADDATNGDNNVINIDPGVTINAGSATVDVPHKYNVGASYAVVGVYDYTGKGIVKVYDDETQIDEMRDEVAEGYKHKDWFKSADFSPESVISDKTAHSGTNFDAYQQAAKLVTLTIKDVPDAGDKQDKIYKDIEQGQTISEADQSEAIKQDLEKIQNAYPDQSFQHYILTDDAKEDEAQTFDTAEELYEVKIEKDSTIEANHDVEVAINGQAPFHIEAGETLATIKDDVSKQGEYTEAKFHNDEKHRDPSIRDQYFWHYEDEDGNIINEDTPITSSTELTTKYYYDVQVDGSSQTFKIGDGEPINSNEDIAAALSELKACNTIDPKPGAYCRAERFSHFVDASNANATVTEETPVTDDITIEAIFDIELQIGDQKFLVDANTTINDANPELKGKIEQALGDLKNVSGGQEIKSIVVSPVGESEQEGKTFTIPGDGADVDALITAIMKYSLDYDVVIYPVCEVTVIIKGAESPDDKTFKIETGKKLSDITDQSAYEQAVYRGNKDRFYRLAIVADDGSERETFDMESEIHASITLRPKFFYTVTLEPLDGEPIIGYVEEGTPYNAFIRDNIEDATNALFAIESNQGHDTEGAEDSTHLHYEGLKIVNAEGADVKEYQDKVNQDIIISGIYHYDLDIVTNYDDPSANLDKYTINFEKKPAETDSNTQIQKSLEKLRASVENDQRKFYTFYNDKGIDDNKEISEDAILNTRHTSHLYITAKVAYKVQIGDTVGYVPEGAKISQALDADLQNKVDLVAALQDLKNPSDKIWREWDIKSGSLAGDPTNENMITGDTVITEATEIGAKYNVKIEISGTPFTIEENNNLNSLAEPDQQSARAALEALMKNDDLTFDHFSTGDKTVDEVMERDFNSNTIITAEHKVSVKIGEDTILVPYDSSVTDEIKRKMDDYPVPGNKSSIAYFINSDEEQIDEDTTHFKKNTELTPKFNVRVKIDGVLGNAGEEILEGGTISTAAKSMEELAAKDTTEQKRFKNAFAQSEYDLTSTPITENTDLLTPLYEIDVYINGDKDTIDEGQNLTDHDRYSYYTSKEGFEEFRDESGTKVEDVSAALHKHTKFTAIYVIYVTVPEELTEPGANKLKLESNQTIGNLDPTLLAKLKANDASGRTFNRFVDENGKTIDEDTPLTESISITPKYNNVLTFKPYADSELVSGVDPAELKVKLGEDLALNNNLSAEDNGKLLQWLSGVRTALAAQGKPDYNPTSYLLEVPNAEDPEDETLVTTTPIDLNTTNNFQNGDTIRVVFTYSPTSVVPNTPPSTPSTNQNPTLKAPDTGLETNDAAAFAIAGAITLIVTSSALAFILIRKAHLRK